MHKVPRSKKVDKIIIILYVDNNNMQKVINCDSKLLSYNHSIVIRIVGLRISIVGNNIYYNIIQRG